jgi:crotonobetainyl-CoA:carnitine CoA-transferase CaiB-like acyl-CoA transferase
VRNRLGRFPLARITHWQGAPFGHLGGLCTDPRTLDLDAFNAPNDGFVVAKDLDYLRARFRDAFATRSASEMEAALNAIGVPAARVRTLKEFLADAPGRVTLPIFDLPNNAARLQASASR